MAKRNQRIKQVHTYKSTNFIKKQILNLTLISMVAFVLLISAVILLIIGHNKNKLPVKIPAYFFIIVTVISYLYSFIMTILIFFNKPYIKKTFGKMFLLLPIVFWLGFKYVDQITQTEISIKYDFNFIDFPNQLEKQKTPITKQ